MVAWVVMDRTHSRQTPPSFFPFRHSYFGSHPSFIPDKFTPFFSRTYVEPILQPLSFDGLPSDAGCTPLLALSPQPPSLDCLFPTPYPYPPFFQALAHSFAHFCTHKKHNPLVLNRFRTLRQKTQPPGWGKVHESPLTSIGFLPPHPIKSPHCPRPAGKWTGQSRTNYE